MAYVGSAVYVKREVGRSGDEKAASYSLLSVKGQGHNRGIYGGRT